MSKRLVTVIPLILIFCIIISCAKKKEIKTATITKIEGKVEYQRANKTNWEDVQSKMKLFSKDKIKVYKASTCEILFEDETVVKLAENTFLQVNVPSEHKYGKEKSLIANIKLTYGRIFCDVKKVVAKEKAFNIETPSALVGIRGTLFSTSVDTDGNTIISVKEGEVEVLGENTSVIVKEGEQTKILVDVMEPEQPILMTQEEAAVWEEIKGWIKEIEEKVEALEGIEDVRITVAKSALSALRMPLELYREDYGEYPKNLTLTTLEELSEYIEGEKILKNFYQNRLVSYRRINDEYEIRAKATNANRTLLILTPDKISPE